MAEPLTLWRVEARVLALPTRRLWRRWQGAFDLAHPRLGWLPRRLTATLAQDGDPWTGGPRGPEDCEPSASSSGCGRATGRAADDIDPFDYVERNHRAHFAGVRLATLDVRAVSVNRV